MRKNESLFKNFPPARPEDWMKAASAEVNGADPLHVLKWNLAENLEFKPIYTGEDVKKHSVKSDFTVRASDRPDARFWFNMPSITVVSEAEANELALMHLRSEADGVIFSVATELNFDALLKGIEWEHCPISFSITNDQTRKQLADYLKKSKYNLSKITGAVYSRHTVYTSPTGIALRWNGIFVEESDPVKKVAEALYKGVQVLNTMKPDEIDFGSISFNISTQTGLLQDIATLKALRFLWAQIAHAYGFSTYRLDDVHIHGRSERWINEKYQPHGNILKSTVAAMSMICGGCNAITIEPEEETNSMMRRIARNVSFILKEESHFGKVNDPFGGAYVVEILVDAIARDAWKKFQEALERNELETQKA